MLRDRLLSTPLLVVLAIISGLLMFVPASHATLMGQNRMAQSFFYSGIIVLILSGMVWLATANWRPANVARSQLASLVGAYLILPVIFALPFYESLPDTTFVNVWFEMVSCFTTTGATVYEEPGRLAPTLHLWRAMIGWVGGFFVLVSATAILAPMNLGGVEVLSGRTPGRGADGVTQITRIADPSERVLRYTLVILPVYGALTLVLWVLLMIGGEVNLVALVHAMSTVSTSGVGTGGDLGQLQSGLVGEALILVFLCFAVTRRLMPGMPTSSLEGPLWRDPEVKLAGLVMALTTTILFLRHWIGAIGAEGGQDISMALRALWGAFFTAFSFLTTTGFISAEWDAAQSWSGLSNPGLILAGLAIIGGGVATTAGGVKLLRIYALARHGERELERLIHPSSIGGAGPLARRIRREGAYFAWLFFMLFALSIAVTCAILSLMGIEFSQALVLTLAALSTTGQLAGFAGAEPIAYAALATPVKLFLAAVMVVGRLETLAILALLSPSSWRR